MTHIFPVYQLLVFLTAPIIAFVQLFGDICIGLAAWCHDLVKQAKSLRRKPTVGHYSDFFSTCTNLIEATDAASDLFSAHLFFLTILIWFGVILTTYRGFAFFIGNYERNSSFVAMVIGK